MTVNAPRPAPPRRPTSTEAQARLPGEAGQWVVIVRSPNLPFALAQAPAVALAGRQVWLRDEAGHGVVRYQQLFR